MKASTSWHDSDEFWETVSPILFTQTRWDSASLEADVIASFLKLRPGIHILDLCCGPGRHSLALARRGFRVTGVDRTPAYIAEASRRAASEGLDVEFVCDDMRAFRRPGAFDVALNLFTSFGYFEDRGDDRKVLANVRQSLKRGGAFLIDVVGKEILARDFREKDWREEGDALILEERKLDSCWDRIETRWLMIRNDHERIERRASMHLYSAIELRSLLEESGFGPVDIYGDFFGSPYDHRATRLVAVGHAGNKTDHRPVRGDRP